MTQPILNQISKPSDDTIFSTVQQIRTEERELLANSLHDGISPLLAIARMNLETINLQDSRQAQHANILIQNTLVLIQHTIEEVKQLTKGLKKVNEPGFNLKKNLQEICQNINDTGLLYVHLKMDKGVPEFNPETGKDLFNIFKELLHNTLKHANATTVKINLKRKSETVMIRYKDNGNGCIPQTIKKQNHLGLNSIYLRMQKLNAFYQIDATPGIGFRLSAHVPISYDHLK